MLGDTETDNTPRDSSLADPSISASKKKYRTSAVSNEITRSHFDIYYLQLSRGAITA